MQGWVASTGWHRPGDPQTKILPTPVVFCHLSRHLVSVHIIFHQVSPSQRWSASIYVPYTVIWNIFLVASSSSRLYTCPNHLNLFFLRNSAIVYMSSFHMSTFLTLSSLVFHLAHRNMSISVVCNSSPPYFELPNILHHTPWPVLLAYFVTLSFTFENCWYIFVAHHTSSSPAAK